VLQHKITKKLTKIPYIGSSRSFKIINVDISEKLVVPELNSCPMLGPVITFTGDRLQTGI